MSAYIVAGRDLSPFVSEWLAEVAADVDSGPSLLDAATEANEERNSDSEYLFNATFLYSRIGPRAAEPEASPEELLLAAVLAVYQHEHGLFRGMHWASQSDHVGRAFRFAQETGDSGMARKLIEDVLRRGERSPEGYEIIRSKNAATDPAKAAYWEAQMAHLDQRELRAAALFDPTADFDSHLLDSALRLIRPGRSRSARRTYDRSARG
jgi:hypothetical protein